MAKAKPKSAKAKAAKAAPATFEATCPTCGMTADVGDDVDAVRCRGCGTIVQLVDDAPDMATVLAAQRLPANEAVPPQAVARPGLALALGLAGPVLLLVAYGTAHTAIDRPEPDTSTASVWYMVTLLLAAGALFLMWTLVGNVPRVAWALLAALPMFAVAQMAGTSYDDDGGAWVVLGVPFFGMYLVAVGITAAVLANRRDASGPAAVLIGGVGLCIGIGAAAVYMLMTLQEQAAEAREAHEAPAWGFLLVAGVLLTLAALRRRDGGSGR